MIAQKSISLVLSAVLATGMCPLPAFAAAEDVSAGPALEEVADNQDNPAADEEILQPEQAAGELSAASETVEPAQDDTTDEVEELENAAGDEALAEDTLITEAPSENEGPAEVEVSAPEQDEPSAPARAADLQKTIAFGRGVAASVEEAGQLTTYSFSIESQMVVRVNLMWEPETTAATKFDVWGFDETSYTSSFKENVNFSQGSYTFEAKLEAGEHSFTVSANDSLAYEVELENVSVYVTGITASDISMLVDETADVNASIEPRTATVKNITYISSNTAVATVDDAGLVTAVKAGRATITVEDTMSGISTTAEVTVTTPPINATNSNQSATIELGAPFHGTVGSFKKVRYTFTLDRPTCVTAKLTWEDGLTYGPDIDFWAFDDSDTYYSDSHVTSFAAHECTYTEVLGKGSHTVIVSGYGTTPYTLTLFDTSIYATDVTAKNVSLFYGKTAKVSYSVSPASTNVKSIKFASSNTAVAKVSASGVITGVKPGTAKITVKDEASGKSTTLTVTVSAATLKRGTGSAKSAYTVALFGNKTLTASANRASTALSWKSSNTAVATVNSKGVVVAKKAGKAVISVKPTYGNAVKWTITVPKVKASSVKVATIPNKEYTAKAQTPALTIKYKGKTLKKGTDYAVKYANNKNIGTAKAVIVFKGSYTGKLTKTFKIVAPKVGKPVFTYWERDGVYSYVEFDRGTNATGIHIRIIGGGWPDHDNHIPGPDGWGECGKKKYSQTVKYMIRSYKKVGNKIFYSGWVTMTF